MQASKLLGNFAILAISVIVAVLLGELASRLFLNASDFLSLEMVQDDVLGAVPSAAARAGFDRWGFRNREVPASADIVAVGDSHTYGNTAKMDQSWPYVLGKLTGRSVYNMGMGGYGPNQYFYLTNTKALTLKPRVIIWGLYMGDDFENAFTITYGLDHWAFLREQNRKNVNSNIWETPPARAGWSKRARLWLSRHSVLYQLAVHASLAGRIHGEDEIRNAARLYPGVATALVMPEKKILEAFRPESMLVRLDQQSADVREGMRITFELLKEMNEVCQKNHIQFAVAVIPTKEMVFSDYLEHNAGIPLDDVIDKQLVNERAAREQTFKFLGDSGILAVDPLPLMKSDVSDGLYAKSAGDMHPSQNGYRVIAEAVAGALKASRARN